MARDQPVLLHGIEKQLYTKHIGGLVTGCSGIKLLRDGLKRKLMRNYIRNKNQARLAELISLSLASRFRLRSARILRENIHQALNFSHIA